MWKMTDAALGFLERCLASYDLESLPSLAEEEDVLAVEAEQGHSPWVAAVDLAVREMDAGAPLEG